MVAVSPLIAAINSRAAAFGLTILSAFDDSTAVPGAQAIALLGFTGPQGWSAFATAPEATDGAPDPLDRWSMRVISHLATAFDAQALFPFGGPPYHPFQRWAARGADLHPSPLGLWVDPQRGLWTSFRGALALPQPLLVPAPSRTASPCPPCPKPCLHACPVGAFTAQGYDVARCSRHLHSAAGAECRQRGCLARLACPLGRDFQPSPAQMQFHMWAFMTAHPPQ